eukprot:TRINITY_DN8582_c0_g1_i1.p2 TRINITY_DN8582_c0_g1~~TRINITY_DN8582_c0_g1_i1.p2  ORF type:complete len:157 (-),score=32.14 TRINITY_DN8582_c0_g1_i1:15-485(-)
MSSFLPPLLDVDKETEESNLPDSVVPKTYGVRNEKPFGSSGFLLFPKSSAKEAIQFSNDLYSKVAEGVIYQSREIRQISKKHTLDLFGEENKSLSAAYLYKSAIVMEVNLPEHEYSLLDSLVQSIQSKNPSIHFSPPPVSSAVIESFFTKDELSFS